jgi:hypothetical protein
VEDTGGRVLLPGLVARTRTWRISRAASVWTRGRLGCYDRARARRRAVGRDGGARRACVTASTTYDVHRSPGCLDLSHAELVTPRNGWRTARRCYAVDERDPASERAAALREGASLARDLKRRRSGRLQAMTGLRARTWPGLEALLEEVSASANEAPLHVELASAPVEGERGSARPAAGSGCLWSHAERAPLALVSEARARGDAMVWARAGAWDHGADPDLAWGSDDGVHAPPRPPEPGSPDLWRRSELYYSRVWVSGPRWAARHFGEGLGTIEAGAPAAGGLSPRHAARRGDAPCARRRRAGARSDLGRYGGGRGADGSRRAHPGGRSRDRGAGPRMRATSLAPAGLMP